MAPQPVEGAAMREAAAQQAVAKGAAVQPLQVVGRSLPRFDAYLKVTGQARYASDLTLPGMVHAALVRSPYPHARIVAVDVAAALALPGVLAVVTGAEITDVPDPFFGPAYKDQRLLPDVEVRYEGEAVAAVVAEDERTAREAAGRVQVTYDELPAVTDLEAALAPGSVRVHERMRPAGHFRDLAALRPVPGTNVCHRFVYARGDVDRVFAEAPHVFDDTFTFPMTHHYSLETYAVVAAWERAGRLIVYASTQHPFPVRQELAQIFGLPLSAVRVVVPYVGGAFGNKSYTKWEPLAAYLARRVGRPVRLALGADEGFRTMRRAGCRCRIRTAVAGDGTLLARDVQADFQTGAYADVAPRVAQKAGYTASGPYRVPHLRIVSQAVYTHTTPAVAFRGYGVPQFTWAYESQMDEIARALGMDPVALRQKNLLRPGEVFMPGDRPCDADLAGDLERLARAIGWAQGDSGKAPARREEVAAPRPPAHTVARTAAGVAVTIKAPLAPSVSQALVRLHADGSATVFTSSVEMGQGSHAVMAQIAAQELQLPPERVRVVAADTAVTPYDQATSASRSTTLMGLAVRAAAQDVTRQLLEIAAGALDVPAHRLWLADGYVTDGRRALSFSEVIVRHYGMPGGELVGTGWYRGQRGEAYLGGEAPFWEVGMGAAQVAVDEETGEVRLGAYVSLADVGKALNPQQCHGQDEGASVMGMGHTFFEELRYQAGRLLNPGLIDYRVPGWADLPERFETLLVENGDGPGPYGAKGIGESGLIPVAPAVANALARLTGVRMRELPLTPERVWRALRRQQG